jgi:hypothetical protein
LPWMPQACNSVPPPQPTGQVVFSSSLSPRCWHLVLPRLARSLTRSALLAKVLPGIIGAGCAGP